METVNKAKGHRHQTAQTQTCAALCSVLKVLQPRLLYGGSDPIVFGPSLHRTGVLFCCGVTSPVPLQLQGEVGSPLGPEELRSPALALLLAALESSRPLLRCVAAEGLARLVQVVGDPGFTISASLLCFDRYADAKPWLPLTSWK